MIKEEKDILFKMVLLVTQLLIHPTFSETIIIKNNLRNISIAALAAPEIDFYCLHNGEENVHVYEAGYIRLLLAIFPVPYKIVFPFDGEDAIKLPDGNGTDTIGMVHRSEFDIAVNVGLGDEDFQDFIFSYPYLFSDATFMTDKPKPNPDALAIIHPFPSIMWILLIAILILFSCILFLHVRRKETYQNVLFMTIGSLLEKSIDIHIRKWNLKLIISVWLMFAFVIINSYKAVLLSILTLPQLTGIKNIPDLAKAAEKNSIICYAYKTSPMQEILLESDFATWRSIGKCLQRNVINLENAEEVFLKAPPNKAFIASRNFIRQYQDAYFITEDSFFHWMFAFSVSKTFRHFHYLNEKIHRLFAAGLFQKVENDEQFILKLNMTSSHSIDTPKLKILQLENLKGAFIVLIFGYTLSIIILFIEIAVKRYLPKSKVLIIGERRKINKKL